MVNQKQLLRNLLTKLFSWPHYYGICLFSFNMAMIVITGKRCIFDNCRQYDEVASSWITSYTSYILSVAFIVLSFYFWLCLAQYPEDYNNFDILYLAKSDVCSTTILSLWGLIFHVWHQTPTNTLIWHFKRFVER